MVQFDCGGRAIDGAAALDHVGVQRALREEVRIGNGQRFAFEHVDEHAANNLAFLLRVGDAPERTEELLARIDDVQIGLEPVAKRVANHLGFAFAHQSIIDVYTRELLADCLHQNRRTHRRIDPAG